MSKENELKRANAEIAFLKYHLSMVNKLTLACADVDGYLDDIDIDGVLSGFDADNYDFDALQAELRGE